VIAKNTPNLLKAGAVSASFLRIAGPTLQQVRACLVLLMVNHYYANSDCNVTAFVMCTQ